VGCGQGQVLWVGPHHLGGKYISLIWYENLFIENVRSKHDMSSYKLWVGPHHLSGGDISLSYDVLKACACNIKPEISIMMQMTFCDNTLMYLTQHPLTTDMTLPSWVLLNGSAVPTALQQQSSRMYVVLQQLN
jgi:hypothetical protein